jgi:putative alpha-1,2-mannosidase
VMGGDKAFTEKLQACFDGGQFAMGNEPDMAYPWLFNYVPSEEWRTRKQVREAAMKSFKAGPAGIPGNDDCGTTSAWYLFANMGFYPDCPGSGEYQLAAPLFEEVVLNLEGGKKVTLKNRSLGENLGSLRWQGRKLKRPVISRDALRKGGTLEFK